MRISVATQGQWSPEICRWAEIHNYLLPSGSLGPRAMIHMGPRALGMGPIIDGFFSWEILTLYVRGPS